MAKSIALAGVDPEIIDKAVAATALRPGMTFREKQIAGWRLVGQGKLKESESSTSAAHAVAQTAKQLQKAVLTSVWTP